MSGVIPKKHLAAPGHGGDGSNMFSLEIDCDPEDQDLLIAELWEQGSAGIVELNPQTVRSFFDDDVNRAALLELYPGARQREEETRDWVQSSRDLLQPMEVGRRFYLVPQWRDDAAPDGRFRIAVNPGMAFGTGVHETTRLCIEALEDYLRHGMSVLDVGTGSGILAKAAKLLGAGNVTACDTDPVAVEIAGQGFVGSVDAVAAGAADLVMANISPEAITALAGDLLRVRKPGGVLLASGFEAHEVEQVRAALPEAREVRHKGKWALLVVGGEGCTAYSSPNLTKTTGRPYIMDEDEFEWDAVKAANNLVKHGVSFEAARCVFDDVFAFERCDFDSAPGELRYVITGTVNDVILTVVYTARDERIRIISARRATKHEQEEYYRSQTAE